MAARLPVTFAKVVTTAGTQVPLVASSTLVTEFVFKANAANTGIIYIGASTVSSTDGYPLAAGESISIDAIDKRKTGSHADDQTDLADWWIDSSVNGEGGRALYIAR